MELGSSLMRFLDRMRHRPKGTVPMSACRIQLQPNDFLGPETVLYYAEREYPVVHEYLADHFHRIDRALQERGMRFVLFPGSAPRLDGNRIELLASFLAYKHPGLAGGDRSATEEIVRELLKSGDAQLLHRGLKEALWVPDKTAPALVHRIYSMSNAEENDRFIYSFAFLDPTNRGNIHFQVEQYLQRVRLTHDEVYFQLADSEDGYDADERFELDGSNLDKEVRNAVGSLKELDNEKALLTSLLFIIKSLKETHPDIIGKLQALLSHPSLRDSRELSRLVVDEQYRILLPDYGLEVEMSPLPKSFYLFMLRHPEGVMFRDLRRYRSELIDIYGTVGNRLDRSSIEASIDDLIDHRSNSVNEKCSRIKEGFVRKIDDLIARNYYITGERKSPKRVALERGLVSLPKGF
jgi:hypothetical protein